MTCLESLGQVCPIPTLSGADTLCLGDTGLFSLSPGSQSLQWDACGNDLFTPAGNVSTFTIPGASDVGGIRFVHQGDTLLAFITNRASGNILRLVYPQGINSSPLVQNLGNFGGAFEGPESFDVEINAPSEKTLVISSILPLLGANPDTTTLTRLHFGNSFMNTPTLTQLPVWKQRVDLPRGLKILEVGDTLFYVQGDFGRNRVEVAWRLKTDSVFIESVSFQVSDQHLCLDVFDCGNHEFYLILGAQLAPPVILKFRGSLNSTPIPLPNSNVVFNERFSKAKWVKLQDSLFVLAGQSDRSTALYKIDIQNDSFNLILRNRFLITVAGPPPTNAYDFIFDRGGWSGLMATFSPTTFASFQWVDTCNAFVVNPGLNTATITFQDTGRIAVAAQTSSNIFSVRHLRALSTPNPLFLTSANCLGDTLKALAVDTSLFYQHLWYVNGTLNSTLNSFQQFLSDTNTLSLQHVTSNQCGVDSLVLPIQIRPAPQAVIIAPDSVCAFALVNLSSQINLPNGLSSLVWKFEANQSFGDSASFTLTSLGANVITLSLVDTIGCKSIDSSVIVALDAPQVNFDIISACIGDSIRLQNTSQGIGSLSATWNIADSTWLSQSYDFSFLPLDTGVLKVNLAVANNTGCENTLERNIRVYALPTAAFQMGDNCEGQMVSVQDSSFSLDDFISMRKWRITNPAFTYSDSSNDFSPSWILPDTGMFTIQLVATTQNGCKDTVESFLYAWQKPRMNFTSSPVCQGDSTQFVNISQALQPGNALIQFLWDLGNPNSPGNTSIAFEPSKLYSNAGNYHVSLSGVTEKGCFGQFSDTVKVYDKPNTSFIPLLACEKEPLQFLTASTLGSDSLKNWIWFEPITSRVDSALQPSFIYDLPGNYPIRLVGTNIFGCKDSSELLFTVHPSPIADFNLSDTFAVLPAEIQFENLSSGITQSVWTFEPGVTDTTSAPLVFYSYNTAGNYQVYLEVRSSQGCKDKDSASIRISPQLPNGEIIQIIPLPSAGKISPSIQIKNTGNVAVQTMLLSFIINGQESFSSFDTIQIPLGETRTLQASDIFYESRDQLCVRIVEINGMSPTSLSRVCSINETGIQILGVYEQGGFLSPRIFSSNATLSEILIFSSQGKELFRKSVLLSPGIREYPIREFYAASGLYILRLISNEGEDIQKFSWIH